MVEFTYVMLKPDGVKLGLYEEVERIFAENGLTIVKHKLDNLNGNKELIREHYAHLLDKSFYPDLENFMMSGDIMPMIVMGENAVAKVRALIGPTNVLKARNEAPDSLRARFGNPDFGPANVIHASDSKENAVVEIKRFFGITITQPEMVEEGSKYEDSGYSKIMKARRKIRESWKSR